jgi:RNA polymerase sigma-70 factor, ECF subfamily
MQTHLGESADRDAPAMPELVELARQESERTLDVIVRQHNRRLYRVARAVVRNDSEAEDVVQESYMRAVANLEQFRGDANLTTWLSRIVLNEAYGRRRRSRPEQDLAAIEARQISGAQGMVSSLHAIDPERCVAQRQIRAILVQAIHDLPEAFRRVLVARAIDDMTVEQAAEFLGLRPTTVKTRLHRARELLKRSLAHQTGAGLTNAFPFGVLANG